MYHSVQPVRRRRTSPGSEVDTLGLAAGFELLDREAAVGGEVDRVPPGFEVSPDIQEGGTARDAAAGPVVDAAPGTGLARHLGALDAVVEAMLGVADVDKGVPLAARLGVEVVEHVVVVDGARDDLLADGASAEEGRVREFECPVEREHLARCDQLRGGGDALGGLEVEQADLVVVAEEPPGGVGRRAFDGGQLVERGEGVGYRHGAHCSGHGRTVGATSGP
ncbi:MAG: hypothetical protein M5U18_16325 [Dehalococcoidia bacterium]|nr:hypothetical protein [Dehalococcoidia bacterium]